MVGTTVGGLVMMGAVGSASAEPAKTAAASKPAAGAAASAKPAPAGKAAGGGQAIVVLVNDEPITAYEVEQRENLEVVSSNSVGEYVRRNAQERWAKTIKDPKINEEFRNYVRTRNPRSQEEVQNLQKQFVQQKQKAMMDDLQREARSAARGGVRKRALDDLIEEKLKLQEAKRLSVVASDEEVEKILKGIAERNKMTVEQFGAHMRSMGADISAMRGRFKAMLSWTDVIRRKFGHQVAITERDVDRAIGKAAPSGEDEVQLQLHKVTVPTSGKQDQRSVAQRLQDADAARAKFNGCKSTPAVAGSLTGAKFEDLGQRKLTSIAEPTRSLLANAKENEMLPAVMAPGGVELWAVCARTVLKADEAKRESVSSELRQKEFEVLATKHLKDLRQDASIEYR